MRQFTATALLSALAVCAAAPAAAHSALETLPAWFEPAAGGRAFVAKNAQARLRLTGAEALLEFANGPGGSPARLAWRLEGAAQPKLLEGLEPVRGRSDYYLGRDSSRWRLNVPHYRKAAAREVYPGIDAVWYAQGRLLEYDFVVAPGADPSLIRFRLDGAAAPRLENGDLVYETAGLAIRKHRPVVYQTSANGERRMIEASYRLFPGGAAGFELGSYDRRLPLVIDPVFSYAGFLGGVRLEIARAVVVDPADGGLWIAGSSQSDLSLDEDAPVYQPKPGGFFDAFIAKVMPGANGGGEVVYWSYFGGSGNDEATAMSLGPDGAIVLAGHTNSLDFPPAGNAWRVDNPQLDVEAFVARFDPRIDEPKFAMTYSSYFGGPGREFPQAVAADGQGRIVIAGYSNSGELPKANDTGLQPSNRGGQDIFFALFDVYAPTAANTLVKSSFLGGNSTDIANFAAFDSRGRIVLAGVTMSDDFPLAGAPFQAERPGWSAAFAAIIDPSLSGLDQLVYGTYIGGSGLDAATAGYLAPDGKLWLTGYTTSSDFLVTPNAAQSFRAGDVDSFLLVADISQSGPEFLKYGTFFGASGADIPYALAVNPQTQTAVIGGYSSSNDFLNRNSPVLNPPSVRVMEAFFAGISTELSGPGAILFSAHYGGKGRDIAYGAAYGPGGEIALVGSTSSDDLPTAAPTGKLNPPGFETGWYLRLLP